MAGSRCADRAAGAQQLSAAVVPPLGPAVPRRFSRELRRGAAWALGTAGWRFEGTLPDLPRFVIAVAPHTSNWDFPIGIGTMLALGLHVRWLGKHSLFVGPCGTLLRSLGGIPVRRGERGGAVGAAIAAFDDTPGMILALAPEGTRKRVTAWKSGYYMIAEGAAVPIVPAWFDWSRRVIGFGAPVDATGGADAMTASLGTLYRPEMGRRPAEFWGA